MGERKRGGGLGIRKKSEVKERVIWEEGAGKSTQRGGGFKVKKKKGK